MEMSQCICLSKILIDSVFRTGENCYTQLFCKEYKYIVNEKRMPKYFTDDLKISSDEDEEISAEENSDKESYSEKS